MLSSRSLLVVAASLIVSAITVPAWSHEGAPCVAGNAGGFACSGVDLAHRLDITELGGSGGTDGSDIWGWTDAGTGREFALVGLSDATSFVEVTDPAEPVYLGRLPTHAGTSAWRDIKTYADHAFIVADHAGSHGMQIFDLSQLLTVITPPVTFTETAHYADFNRAHNIVIDEATARAFAVGSEVCSGGLHVLDISVPTSPAFEACVDQDGYTHDAQCLVYAGPDAEHVGKEICVNFNEDTVTLFDVTDPENPVQLSRSPYTGSGYTHQGWLTEDHAYLLLGDEGDESGFGHNTKTYIWDLTDLDAPFVTDEYLGPVGAIDHNLYTLGDYVFESNYRSGLRILHIGDLSSPDGLEEVAYFDTYPASDSAGFSGAWSSYPYFPSGTVVVSDIQGGLFVLQPTSLCPEFAGVTGLSALPAGDQQIDLSWTDTPGPGETYSVYRSFGACPGTDFELVAEGLVAPAFSDTSVSGTVTYSYDVRKVNVDGCPSLASGCADAVTTGACVAPAIFAGLEAVSDPSSEGCALDLSWTAAQPNCGVGVTYSVYRSQTPDLAPSGANRVASGLTTTSWSDLGVLNGETYYYVVRATDTGNGIQESNLVERSGVPSGPPSDGTWSTGAEVGDPVLISDSGSAAGLSKHAGWHLSETRVHGGSRSYFSEYTSNLCTSIQTPSLGLSAGEASEFSFWTVYDIEDDDDGTAWDGGVVEISVGGAPFQLLDLTPGYPQVWRSSADACGYDTGTPAFTGTNLTWTKYTADLSAYAGQNVEIAFRFSTDGAATEEGWYIDDVEITHAQIPGLCALSDLFTDGFESGDTSGWSSAVGDTVQ